MSVLLGPGISLYWKTVEIHRNGKIMAKGVIFNEGKCVIRWEGKHKSIVIWDSLDDLKAVSGHPGTIFVITDDYRGPQMGICRYTTTTTTN